MKLAPIDGVVRAALLDLEGEQPFVTANKKTRTVYLFSIDPKAQHVIGYSMSPAEAFNFAAELCDAANEIEHEERRAAERAARGQAGTPPPQNAPEKD